MQINRMDKPLVTFTLDTNCIIDLDEVDRPNKTFVLELLSKSNDGHARISILASSASEKQIGGAHLESFSLFEERLTKLGLGHLELLQPIAKFGLSFYGFAVMPTEEQLRREEKIFQTLFPERQLSWQDFAQDNSLDPSDLTSDKAWKWRNRLCDAQAYWSHEISGNDHFVTNDRNFRKKLTIESGFPKASIVSPEEAVAILHK